MRNRHVFTLLAHSAKYFCTKNFSHPPHLICIPVFVPNALAAGGALTGCPSQANPLVPLSQADGPRHTRALHVPLAPQKANKKKLFNKYVMEMLSVQASAKFPKYRISKPLVH